MIIGNKEFDCDNSTYIMGILNITPDSFSDGGKYNDMDQALFHVEEMIEKGADIIDIGGESTRPNYTLLSDEEEISRVVPIVEAVKKRFAVPISIDTYKSGVADAAILAGANLVNDIWGLKYDGKLAQVISKHQVPCCLMHNRKEPDYNSFLVDMCEDLKETVAIAKEAGVEDDKIILDPGVGFGKTYANNLEAIYHVGRLHELGYPVLLGTSRKSVIGNALDLPVDQRVEGTLVTTVFGVMQGCAFIRVHDVEANKRAVLMTRAIMGK